MIEGISHITFIVRYLDRMTKFLTEIFFHDFREDLEFFGDRILPLVKQAAPF